MYEKAIWPPKQTEPPKPKLNTGYVIRSGHMHFVAVRVITGLVGPEYHEALRLFEIRTDGRLATNNRYRNEPAMDTHEYKTCTAIWQSVDDFVADMERASVQPR